VLGGVINEYHRAAQTGYRNLQFRAMAAFWSGTGCDKPPAGCDVHHLVFRSRGGKTRLKDLLLCAFHHDVCVVRHERGEELAV